MSKPTVVLKREPHRGQQVLSIYTPNAEPFNSIVRKLKATYSATKKMWWLAWDKGTVNTAFKAFKDVAFVDYSALKSENEKREQKKGTSEQDIRTELNPPITLTQKGSQRKQLKNMEWTQAQKDVQPVGFHT